jgi:5-methylcytosine-specific restriction endonuclease McrA
VTGRSVPEWVGSSPDAKVPPHVRLRIFERAKGICHIAKRKIRFGEPWDLEHVVALADWTGEGHGNRESNLAPALQDKHREKTAAENRERAKVRRKKSKALGIKVSSGGFRGWRRFNGDIVRADRRR